MADVRLVILVTEHDDTAELYQLALEHAAFRVTRCRAIEEAEAACRARRPIAIVVHFAPRHDPVAAGSLLRAENPQAVLIGLFSIQLSQESLKGVLDKFDDAIVIPCSPDALVTRIVRLHQRKEGQASA